MLGRQREPAGFVFLAAILIVAACGSDNAASPSGPQSSGAVASPSGPVASAVASAAASASATTAADPVAPTPSDFWALAARALAKTGRMRLILVGSGTRELRFESRASGVVADGSLMSVCVAGAAYALQGFRSTVVPGKWACGGSALVSSMRKSGQPAYAWNSRLPVDTRIKERVSVASKGHWQWDYVAVSRILDGTVRTTLLLDAATGRLVSGSRTDRTGRTRYTFSYTTIFAPIALP